ncbi:MAG: hypothetical protein LBB60_03255, partial [Desulfovibrio sp.]|nr:hypothetical protein [Desulfovibrio sp.]
MTDCPRCHSSNIAKNGKHLEKQRYTGQLIDWECGARDQETFGRLMTRLFQFALKYVIISHTFPRRQGMARKARGYEQIEAAKKLLHDAKTAT